MYITNNHKFIIIIVILNFFTLHFNHFKYLNIFNMPSGLRKSSNTINIPNQYSMSTRSS